LKDLETSEQKLIGRDSDIGKEQAKQEKELGQHSIFSRNQRETAASTGRKDMGEMTVVSALMKVAQKKMEDSTKKLEDCRKEKEEVHAKCRKVIGRIQEQKK